MGAIMRNRLLFLSLLGILSSCLGDVAAQTQSKPHLIVRKTLITDHEDIYGIGQNFTVRFDVYNVGGSSAFDVVVTDPWPSSDPEKFTGKDSSVKKWKEIPEGTHEEFEFSRTP